jgi:hypothetical protein
MKKGNSFIYFGMFFITAFIGEIYCLLEFRDDVINIVGVGIVLMIASYLWLDSIRSIFIKEMEQIDDKVKNVEKLQKAIYVLTKRLNTEDTNKVKNRFKN